MDYDEEDSLDQYDPELYEDFGEGFENEFDAVSEKAYEKAFDEAKRELEGKPMSEEADNEDDYEFDEVVGGRDKKPVMSILNKGKLSKYEMDDLLNEL